MHSIIPSVYFMKDTLLTNYDFLDPEQRSKLEFLGIAHEYTQYRHSFINELLDSCQYVMLVNPCDLLNNYQFVFEAVFDVIDNPTKLRKLLIWPDKSDTISWSLKGSFEVFGFEYQDDVFDQLLRQGSLLARYMTGSLMVEHPDNYVEEYDPYSFITKQSLKRNRQHLLTLLAWYRLYNYRGCKSTQKKSLYKELDKIADAKIQAITQLISPSTFISVNGSGKSVYINSQRKGFSFFVSKYGNDLYLNEVDFNSYIHYVGDRRVNGYSSDLRLKTLSVVNQRNFMGYYVSKDEYSYMLIQSAVSIFSLVVTLGFNLGFNVLPLRISLDTGEPMRTECFLMYPIELRQQVLDIINKFRQHKKCVRAITIKDIAFDDVIDEDNQAKLF